MRIRRWGLAVAPLFVAAYYGLGVFVHKSSPSPSSRSGRLLERHTTTEAHGSRVPGFRLLDSRPSRLFDLHLLSNPHAAARLEEETLKCVQYSGPCFFMNHPRGTTAPTVPLLAAKLPWSVEQMPTLQPTPVPLRPFSLHNVSLLAGTRFHVAQQTNLEWLRRLEP